MILPLMPKATAVWLIDNTGLSFGQIAEFCGMHPLEIKGIADGEVLQGIIGQDPIISGQLTTEEIKLCEENSKRKLKLNYDAERYLDKKKKKSAKYTPVARRQDKPDAISWILKNCPTASDLHIAKLLGTTKSTIESIKVKSHWNILNIRPRDPVLLGLCTQVELDNFFAKNKINEDTNQNDV
jgi:hypothetical protein